MEPQSPQVPLGDLPILNFIRQKYLPASMDTATVRLTTVEIVQNISEHLGYALEPLAVSTWLTDNGYTYDTVGDMRFEWLMKETE